MTWAILLASLAAPAALAAGAVALRARHLRLRARRLAADVLEPRSTFPTVVVVPARHLLTAAGTPPGDALLPGFRPDTEGVLGVTDRELVLDAPRGGGELLRVPLARVVDLALVRRHGQITSEQVSGGLLQVRWRRGGEVLQTVFALLGRRQDGERLRREIHLRAAALPKATLATPGPGLVPPQR